MKRHRYVGTSRMFSINSNSEFSNSLDIDLSDENVDIKVRSLIEPERAVSVSGDRATARALRNLLLTMERETLRARRQAGEFAIPKPKARRKPRAIQVCMTCNGYGGNADDENNWKECPDCVQ